ncbi:MAG: hypothetical protein COB98_10295 [Flavobacteriaceae bacterium]|nr:MAG: hypothetical protein COB98_10295 [Flavobacteriaceae bacterium]
MKTTLEGDFPYLKALLGGGGFTHPSGETRIDFMRQYLKLATHTTPVDAFYDSFGNIWNL